MHTHTTESPTEILEGEHRLIQTVVANMARIADSLEQGKAVEVSALRELVRFLKTFGDECHHAKEETALFPMLELKGVPVAGCPIAVLHNDHLKARVLVGELADAVDAYGSDARSGQRSLLAVLRELVAFYPGHIWKEDYLLFPLAKKVLSSMDERILSQHFEHIEAALGASVHERFEQFVTELDLATSGRQEPCPVCHAE